MIEVSQIGSRLPRRALAIYATAKLSMFPSAGGVLERVLGCLDGEEHQSELSAEDLHAAATELQDLTGFAHALCERHSTSGADSEEIRLAQACLIHLRQVSHFAERVTGKQRRLIGVAAASCVRPLFITRTMPYKIMQRVGVMELADACAAANRVPPNLDGSGDLKKSVVALQFDIENLALDLAQSLRERVVKPNETAAVAEGLLERVKLIGSGPPKKHGSRPAGRQERDKGDSP